ncbi:unnamed protein product [Zymoseptoria tritici ST99CH_1A5]|nr:unnamed protein product [Zymoseptoria tritici ST99CH_1E4]SMR45030.1 unnamed protein product [Zymoseptoria tritici ST99CH_3D1]SMY20195.1 unnamed protein product [Zymoseptoria tritici ST99CH_1A5]
MEMKGFSINEMPSIPINRRMSLLGAVLILGTLYAILLHWPQTSSTSSFTGAYSSPSSSSSSSNDNKPSSSDTTKTGWTFVPDRDRNDHSLTSEQCSAAFPDLYREIDRSRAYWKARQGEEKLTDKQWGLEWSSDGGLRVMIWEQQLYIIESRGLNHFLHWKERSHATLHNLQRAILASKEPVPNIEFSIKINDNIALTDKHPNATVWNFNRDVNDKAMEQVWLIPDFNFWAYPRVAGSYGHYQRQAMDMGSDYNSKKPQLVWRGTTDFNPEIRLKLLEAAKDKPWSAVHKVAEDVKDEENMKYRITMPDHCKYKFAVHTEGTTWSGRLKYLLSCHSTIVVHPLTFTTHLYHLLESDGPNQNFVQVRKDWSDLPKTMEALLADNTKAKRIADNAAAKFRDQYFTPAAQTCYFRQLFKVWSEMTPVPDPYEHETLEDGSVQKTWRGMSYEEYVFYDKGYNDEH